MSLLDLASLDSAAKADDGADLEVLHPVSGEKLGVVIRLAGADSAVPSTLTTSRPRTSRFWPAARSAGRGPFLTARPFRSARTPPSPSTRAFRGCASKWKPSSRTARTICRTDCRAVRSRRRLRRREQAGRRRFRAARPHRPALQADREKPRRTRACPGRGAGAGSPLCGRTSLGMVLGSFRGPGLERLLPPPPVMGGH